MAVLLLAEIDAGGLNEATNKAMTAAKSMGGDVHVLVAGEGCQGLAGEAAKIDGAAKVFCASDAAHGPKLAEPIADLIVSKAGDYEHLVAPATASGKNIMARVAGLLDVMIVSDITGVEGADTFERPIYAGNAMATVKSTDAKKVVTVRGASFAAAGEQAPCPVEEIGGAGDKGLSAFVSEQKSESDRPQLTSAKIVVSGGRARWVGS